VPILCDPLAVLVLLKSDFFNKFDEHFRVSV
jgi:hypothetical protein